MDWRLHLKVIVCLIVFSFEVTELWSCCLFVCLFVVIGSNTHNNNSPAGDGQAGDAGEGKGGK